jgi:U4/U6.U5 tri-snRNP-associated protein 2
MVNKVRPLKSTIIENTFQGEIEISTLKLKEGSNTGGKNQRGIDVQYVMAEETKKFLFLSLDVPPVPIFKDDSETLTIPQIPLQLLLKKFDGKTFIEEKGTTVRKRMRLKKLPKYLIFHIKRFSKNQFFKEKNHTIINIPLNLLDMKPYVDCDTLSTDTINPYRYMLISNIKHNGDANKGNYVAQVRYRPDDDEWYEIQDLHVNKVMNQQVAISESYMLIYEQLPPTEEEFDHHIDLDHTNVFGNLPSGHQNGHSDPNDPVIQDETVRKLDDSEERIIT